MSSLTWFVQEQCFELIVRGRETPSGPPGLRCDRAAVKFHENETRSVNRRSRGPQGPTTKLAMIGSKKWSVTGAGVGATSYRRKGVVTAQQSLQQQERHPYTICSCAHRPVLHPMDLFLKSRTPSTRGLQGVLVDGRWPLPDAESNRWGISDVTPAVFTSTPTAPDIGRFAQVKQRVSQLRQVTNAPKTPTTFFVTVWSG
jgi:hypothetical protein